jgi:tRNA-dihydrouridine synthase B
LKTPRFKNLELKNPLLMSPLCGVTDLPFRALVREQGCALTHTQMISSAALARSQSIRTLKIMELGPDEAPVGIQLFGCDPEEMAQSARRADIHGADLISINFGCPVPKVVKHNGGSAMLKEPKALQQVTKAVVDATEKPVVPKIRIGWDEDNVNAVDIARRIEDAGAAGLVIHGRTRSQGYAGRANWDVITEVKARVKIPVIGNGDLFTPEEIKNALDQSGVDGVMLGRGAMGNPWLFSRTLALLEKGESVPEPGPAEKIGALLKHLRMSFAYKGAWGLAEMRKQSMWYLKGLPWASETRNQLNQTLDMSEIEALLESYRLKLFGWEAGMPSPELALVGGMA